MISCGLRRAFPVKSTVSVRLPLQALPVVRFQSIQPVVKKRPATIDRELPDPLKLQKKNRRYFIVYAIGVAVSCAVIFNYEKTGSPIINSLMYCLRRSEVVKKALGDNIGYASEWPWIWGPLNTVQGRIDIHYKVKGDEQGAEVFLKANRSSAMQPFVVEHVYLKFDDGTIADLLQDSSVDFEF